jgi:glycosyltransferase involved in cell wall biosynthesis
LLLILGRVHPVKGIEIAIQAMRMVLKSLPTAVLVIAGPGEARYDRGLVDLAAAVGVQDRVRRVPMIAGVDKYQLLRDADLVLLPSRQENFGNVAAEALSIGTPVIASQATPWQSLEHTGCGRWVPLTAEAFAEAIVQLAGDRVRLDAARKEAPIEFRKYRAPDFLRKMMALYTAGASGAPIPSLLAGDR